MKRITIFFVILVAVGVCLSLALNRKMGSLSNRDTPRIGEGKPAFLQSDPDHYLRSRLG